MVYNKCGKVCVFMLEGSSNWIDQVRIVINCESKFFGVILKWIKP